MTRPALLNPSDFESIDSILLALHEVISGRQGISRDWRRFRSLFVPEARLIQVVHDEPSPGECRLIHFDLDSFERFFETEILTGDFFEREVQRRVEQFGRIAHTFSTYESRRSEAGPTFQRGVNSFQLFQGETGWRIVGVLWDSERPESPIPDRYLPDAPL